MIKKQRTKAERNSSAIVGRVPFPRKAVTQGQTRVFQEMFDVPLRDYFDGIFGFDVVKFDKEIVKSGDGVMRNAVHKRWGADAVQLLVELIAI